MVEEDRWDELLRQVPIHRGDFFQIEPGCLHAIKGGTLILETQQSSDVTYRFYDYGRLQDGKPRQLHIAQSLDVTRAPFRPAVPERETWRQGDAVITRLVKCPYYTVYHGEVDGELKLDLDAPFVNLSVLAGQGTLDGPAGGRGRPYGPHGGLWPSCRQGQAGADLVPHLIRSGRFPGLLAREPFRVRERLFPPAALWETGKYDKAPGPEYSGVGGLCCAADHSCSTMGASGAFFFTDSMPLRQPAMAL